MDFRDNLNEKNCIFNKRIEHFWAGMLQDGAKHTESDGGLPYKVGM